MNAVLACVPNACGFLDDCTVRGRRVHWRKLWRDTLATIRALKRAGFMINLCKCSFMVPCAVVLGRQLSGGSYQLAAKFMKSWAEIDIPTNVREL